MLSFLSYTNKCRHIHDTSPIGHVKLLGMRQSVMSAFPSIPMENFHMLTLGHGHKRERDSIGVWTGQKVYDEWVSIKLDASSRQANERNRAIGITNVLVHIGVHEWEEENERDREREREIEMNDGERLWTAKGPNAFTSFALISYSNGSNTTLAQSSVSILHSCYCFSASHIMVYCTFSGYERHITTT